MADNVSVVSGALQGDFTIATKDLGGNIHAQQVAIASFLTPAGDSMVVAPLNALAVAMVNRLEAAEDSITVVVPADPFGVNGDAASATGSLSAKLRHLAEVGLAGLATLPAGTALVGDVDLQLRATGGATPFTLTSAASTNATSVKASGGKVVAIQAFNVNAEERWLKFYNKASAPTVGTDPVIKKLAIPGNTAAAGFIVSIPHGIAFSAGIAFALTTGVADSDVGAVAAAEVVVNLDYK